MSGGSLPISAMPAFDLLCACKASAAAKFVCVYGMEDDRRAVDHLATMFPVTRVPIQATGHNVIFKMLKEGTLRQFYREHLVSGQLPAAAPMTCQ